MAFVCVKTNCFELPAVITYYHVASVGANQDFGVGLVPSVASEVGTINLNVMFAAQLAPLDLKLVFCVFFVPNEVLETVWTCN